VETQEKHQVVRNSNISSADKDQSEGLIENVFLSSTFGPIPDCGIVSKLKYFECDVADRPVTIGDFNDRGVIVELHVWFRGGLV
jgi:hypothetical protein